MTPLAERPQTRKQELVAAILSASSHLKISKTTVTSLAKFGVRAEPDVVSSLLKLLAQPDPYGSLSAVLPAKLREAQANYTDTDENDFALWVHSANNFFHDLDAVVRSLYSVEKPTGTDYLTARFVQGAVHYHSEGVTYSAEQVKTFAFIAAAANAAEVAWNYHEGDTVGTSLIYEDDSHQIPGHHHMWCCHLSSKKVRDIVVDKPELAVKIMRYVTELGIHTEEALLHQLEGGHTTLARGAL